MYFIKRNIFLLSRRAWSNKHFGNLFDQIWMFCCEEFVRENARVICFITYTVSSNKIIHVVSSDDVLRGLFLNGEFERAFLSWCVCVSSSPYARPTLSRKRMPTVIGVLKQYKHGTLWRICSTLSRYSTRIYNLRTWNEREQGLRSGVCYVRVYFTMMFLKSTS